MDPGQGGGANPANMARTPDILCIGSVLWDIIGRTDLPMVLGNDKPGRIARLPGGVALNIAIDAGALRAQAGPGVGGGGRSGGARVCWRPARRWASTAGRCWSIPICQPITTWPWRRRARWSRRWPMPIRWRAAGGTYPCAAAGRAAGVGGGALGWPCGAGRQPDGGAAGRDRRKPGLRRGRPGASRLPRRARPSGCARCSRIRGPPFT